MQVNETNENKEFTPLIVAFCCNWCSYAGADLAGSSRLNYPANVKIIRVPCSCRVNPLFILRAFETYCFLLYKEGFSSDELFVFHLDVDADTSRHL